MRSHTPARCQSRSRRQHVIPDPQPSSGGTTWLAFARECLKQILWTSAAFRSALDLFETGLNLMRQNLRRAHPHAGDDEIEQLLGSG
jgi:hypothetical protein